MDLGAYEQTWDATAPYCYENHRNKRLDEEQRTCAAYYNMDASLCGSADKRHYKNEWIFTTKLGRNLRLVILRTSTFS